MDTGITHAHPFLAEGVVAQIVEDDEGRRARVVLREGMILELAADTVPDAHLGGRVELGGFITVEFVSAKDVRLPSDPPA